jgi:hypothetical protein
MSRRCIAEQFVFPFDAYNPGLANLRTPLPNGACTKFYESRLHDNPPQPETPSAPATTGDGRRSKKKAKRAAAKALVKAAQATRECNSVDSLQPGRPADSTHGPCPAGQGNPAMDQ